MANTDKVIQTPIVNKLKKSTFETITPSEDEFYLVDPEFTGNKLLETDSNGNIVETNTNYATENYVQNYHDTTKQDNITDLSSIRENAQTGADLAPQVAVNTQRIEDLTTSRIPDVIYHGTPRIVGGQVSNFSTVNYLQFPFEDISRGLPFDIYFSFTTDDDVTTQQNIIDSHFGIALAIQNSKGVMALSSNGTTWDIGTSTGATSILPNTTYYVKYSWTGSEYNASISTNEQSYTPDMVLVSDKSPYKTTIYIGGSEGLFGAGSAHPFKGIINFSKSRVEVNGITVWEGMADVGIASRANVSLTNLDEVGEGKFNTKQDVLTSANAGDNVIITNQLPNIYTKLEFLESTGTQYINTSTISIDNTDTVYFKYAYTTTNTSPRILSFTQESYNDSCRFNFTTDSGRLDGNLQFGIGTHWINADITKIDYIYDTKSVLREKNPLFIVNDINYATMASLNFIGISGNLTLFRGYYSNNYKYTSARIYELNIVNKIHLIPCKRNADGVLGMYDTVSNTFFTNAGTGEFIAGREVTSGIKISAIVPIKTSDLINDNNFITSSYHDDTKQDILTPGNGINISDNKISNSLQFAITEDMFDLEYDDTKGVAPYSTSYGYTNITIHEDAGVEWVEGAIYVFVLNTKVVTSTYRNTRVRIGETGDWKPVMATSGIANGASYLVKAMNTSFQYKSVYQSGGALHVQTDNNTTYAYLVNTLPTGGLKIDANGYGARYSLVFPTTPLSNLDETFSSLVTSSSTSTSKKAQTALTFYADRHTQYIYSANIGAGAVSANATYQDYQGLDLRYTANTSTAWCTVCKKVFLWLKDFDATNMSFKADAGIGAILTIDKIPDKFPSSTQGDIYLYFLGWTSTTWYTLTNNFTQDNKIFKYTPSNGNLVELKPITSLDNKTVSLNTNKEIQAIGVIEKNKNSAIYDWVGTLQEYESQGVGTAHPDWVCYITDDYSESVGVSEEEVNAIVQKNLVTSLSETSTDTQYPSAKCIYDILNSLKQELEEL